MMSAKEPLRITREELRALSEKDIIYAAGAKIMLQRGVKVALLIFRIAKCFAKHIIVLKEIDNYFKNLITNSIIWSTSSEWS